MYEFQVLLQKNADSLFPKLCVAYMKKKEGYQSAIELIKVISGVCSPQFLENVYLKHMKKLIEEYVSEKHKNPGHAMTNCRECDIIVNMAHSIDIAKNFDTSKKFVKSFLPEKQGYQKKAFKLLNVMIDRVHPSFLIELYEMVEGATLVSSGAKAIKLQCFFKILNKIEFSDNTIHDIVKMVQVMLPEVLIALKESNQKTR